MLRTRLARWLNGPAVTPAEPSASAASASNTELLQRIEKLELERPAFLAELESIYERCHDVLDTAESKRARTAAKESRLKKREENGEQDQLPLDREHVKNMVRATLVPSWRR